MSKFSCKCGYVMNLSEGWSSYELTMLPEGIMNHIMEELDDNNMDSDKFLEITNNHELAVYRCPSCNRLWLESGVNSNHFISYIIENNE